MSEQKTDHKSIETLVPDIQDVLVNGADVSIALEQEIPVLKNILEYRLSKEAREESPRLRMSNLGAPCDRKRWYSVNKPEKEEPLTPSARLKFLYGDILEWLILLLAKAAGHKVEGQQTELDINGIKGHRDAIIDGTLVDVKSASKYGFQKFKTNSVPKDDAFGYMDQLGAYHYASLDDVRDKEHAAFLAVEKEQGHLVLDTYKLPPKDYAAIVEQKKKMLAQENPPPRAFEDIPDGASGNRKLGVNCSYCSFKATCWENLRGYKYSTGPRYLTKIVREPDVPRLF